MNIEEDQYLKILADILEFGDERVDRTGVGTKALFGKQMRFNVGHSFPLLTTKKMAFKNTVRELLWFISGSTNAFDLPKPTQPWWTPWASDNGDLGPTYGKMFREIYNKSGEKIDQLGNVITSLKENKYSRRHIISLWQAEYMPQTNLPCCHGTTIQFFVQDDDKLSCSMYQRSADFFIGESVNLSTYALLLKMVASICDYKAHELIITTGDSHIYNNHTEQCKEQISRTPLPFPMLTIDKVNSIDDYKLEHFHLDDYKYHPAIKAPVAV